MPGLITSTRSILTRSNLSALDASGSPWQHRAGQKGLGFVGAGNFYPDFLLFLVNDATGQQWLSFVDPGASTTPTSTTPSAEIIERQKEVADPHLILNAFILSYTPHCDLLSIGTAGSKAELEDHHVLFIDDGRDANLCKLSQRIAA